LLNLIDQLPRNSRYIEALADDEDLATQVLASKEPPEPAGPRLSEWSPELAALTAIQDRLGEVIAAVIAAAGGRPPRLRPSPRPKTAADRVRLQQRQERHLALVARVLPGVDSGALRP
jgi:hypothetical protein